MWTAITEENINRIQEGTRVAKQDPTLFVKNNPTTGQLESSEIIYSITNIPYFDMSEDLTLKADNEGHSIQRFKSKKELKNEGWFFEEQDD